MTSQNAEGIGSIQRRLVVGVSTTSYCSHFLWRHKNLKALEAFNDGLLWEWSFSVMGQLDYDAAAVHAVADALVNRLEGAGRLEEAATIVNETMDDAERAIVLWVQAQNWARVIMLTMKHKRSDLLETHFRPAVLEAALAFNVGHNAATEGGLLSQFNTHAARLVAVRAEKLIKQEAEDFGYGTLPSLAARPP
jgi:hypothetical protein